MQYDMTRIRFPHSAIPGSILAVRSPRLIADFYGLHRYWLSRHPLSVPLITFLCIDLTSNRSSITRSVFKIFIVSKLLIGESLRIILKSYKRPQKIPRFPFLFVEVAKGDLLKLPSLYRTKINLSTLFFVKFNLQFAISRFLLFSLVFSRFLVCDFYF